MALKDRMRVIQADLKQKQAYIDARPQRVKEWSDDVAALYDVLEYYLSDEKNEGLCTIKRSFLSANSDDLGEYKVPSLSVWVEHQAFFSSTPRKSANSLPDLVDLTSRGAQHIVRIAFIATDKEEGWAITAASDADQLTTAQMQWLNEQNFKRFIEPFFRVPGH